MEKRIDRLQNFRNKAFRTPYMHVNSGLCKACWKCMEACPKQVIGKIGFLWHKHIIIQNPENCTGCLKCLKSCPQHAFSSVGQHSQERE